MSVPAGFTIDAPSSAGAVPDGFALDVGSAVLGGAKAAGIGLAKGAIGVGGMAGDLRSLIEAGVDKIADKFGVSKEHAADLKGTLTKSLAASIPLLGPAIALGPNSADIQKGVESVTGEFRKPQNRAERYLETAASFVPAAIGPGGPGAIVKNLLKFGIAPGVASEAGGEAAEGLLGPDSVGVPIARAAAGVGTGGAAALLLRPKTAATAVRGAVGDTDPQVIAAAEQLFQDAHAAGQPITRAEAIQHVTGGATNLGNLQRVVEGSGEMRPFMAQRAGQNEAALGPMADTIAPAAVEPSMLGPASGRAASAEIRDVRGAINTAAEPHYTAAQNVRLNPTEMARVRALPGYPAARDAVRDDPQLNRYVAGLPEDSVGFLNEVKKQLDQSARNSGNAVNPQQNMQRSAGFGRDATAVRNAAVRASTEYETALAIETFGREQVLQPLQKGPLGQLAKKDITTQRAISVLFPTDPLPNSAGEITTAVNALAQRNPLAARQLVRAHVEKTFNEAAQNLVSGPNEFGGAKFAAVIRGNQQQAANLEAAVRALPQGDQIYTGLDRFLQYVEAQGQRQRIGSQTAFNQEVLQDLRRGTPMQEAGTAALSGGLKLPQKISDTLQRWRLGEGVGQIADLLTNPRSADMFRIMSMMPTGSNEAAIIAGKLVFMADRGIQASDGPLKVTVTPSDRR